MRFILIVPMLAAALRPGPPAGPAIPELNRKVLEFAEGRLGRKVNNGQCTMFAYEALASAGARRFPWEPSGDYVWGEPVASFKETLPGDILQFRDAVYKGRRNLTPRRWVSWHAEYPHHTAVVAAVNRGGREVVVLHQNVGPRDVAEKVVRKDTIQTDSLQPGGRVWIFRPVADPDDVPNAGP